MFKFASIQIVRLILYFIQNDTGTQLVYFRSPMMELNIGIFFLYTRDSITIFLVLQSWNSIGRYIYRLYPELN